MRLQSSLPLPPTQHPPPRRQGWQKARRNQSSSYSVLSPLMNLQLQNDSQSELENHLDFMCFRTPNQNKVLKTDGKSAWQPFLLFHRVFTRLTIMIHSHFSIVVLHPTPRKNLTNSSKIGYTDLFFIYLLENKLNCQRDTKVLLFQGVLSFHIGLE